MPQSEQFEVLVLGSGTGGKLVAWHMTQSGRRTAVVERRWIGGSCPNIACMPSKNEISSARIAHLARHGGDYGTVTGSVTVDIATVRRRKREMVERQIAQHMQLYRTTGAELIMGSGRFLAPKTLEVKLNDGGTRVLAADKVFLNVGTHAAIPKVPGLEEARPLTHVELLELDYLPQHLIAIGGGYSGLELARAYRRFGSDVTVIESGPQLLAREDIDVSREMRRILGDEGIKILVEAELLQVRGRSGDKVTLTVRTLPVSDRSKAATSWSRLGAFRTRAELALKKPASKSTDAVTFASLADWRPVRRTYGRSVNAPAARNSRTYPKTTFESYVTISQAEIATPAIGWFHIPCSLIRRSPASG